jgi:hypothetical protein
VHLGASLTQAAPSGGNIFKDAFRGYDVFADLTAPIFHGRTLKAQRQAAVEDARAANANYQDTVLSAFGQVADLLQALAHDQQTVEAQSQALTVPASSTSRGAASRPGTPASWRFSMPNASIIARSQAWSTPARSNTSTAPGCSSRRREAGPGRRTTDRYALARRFAFCAVLSWRRQRQRLWRRSLPGAARPSRQHPHFVRLGPAISVMQISGLFGVPCLPVAASRLRKDWATFGNDRSQT